MAVPLTILGVFPIPEVRTGGQKRYIELTRQLVERGHGMYQICRPALAEQLPGRAVPVIPDRLSGYLVPRWFRYRKWVRRRMGLIRRALAAGAGGGGPSTGAPGSSRPGGGAPDLVLAFGETNFPAARLLARRFRVPLVFALRSNFVEELLVLGNLRLRLPFLTGLQRRLQLWWYLRLERSICRNADAVVFQSGYDRDSVARRNPDVAVRAVVIANSFVVSWLPKRTALSNRSTSLTRGIYVGHLNERKGIQFLLAALAGLPEGPDFDIVGFGTLESWCRDYVEEHGLTHRVTFYGRLDSPLELLAAADLLVVPSIYDSFPNTVLEALFVGTPVIGSDVAGIRTMLEDPLLLFPRGDVEALADRIRRFREDRQSYARARAICHERREHFAFDWADEWEKLFRRLSS